MDKKTVKGRIISVSTINLCAYNKNWNFFLHTQVLNFDVGFLNLSLLLQKRIEQEENNFFVFSQFFYKQNR